MLDAFLGNLFRDILEQGFVSGIHRGRSFSSERHVGRIVSSNIKAPCNARNFTKFRKQDPFDAVCGQGSTGFRKRVRLEVSAISKCVEHLVR